MTSHPFGEWGMTISLGQQSGEGGRKRERERERETPTFWYRAGINKVFLGRALCYISKIGKSMQYDARITPA